MGDKFYLSEEFKALNEIWKQKLKDAGFKDAENDRDNPYLKNWDSNYFFRHYSPEEFDENETYYRIAAHFYWNYAHFKNDLEKRIWALHSDGHSRRKISQLLFQEGLKISGGSIQIIVSSLKKIMHSGLWASSEGRIKNDVNEKSDSLSRLPPRR